MPTLNQVNEVKRILGYGARKNLWNLNLTLPGVLGLSAVESNINLLAKNAILPGTRDLETYEVKYKGEVFNIATDKGPYTAAEFKIIFDNPQNFAERNAFELWINMIQTDFTGQRTSPTIYKSNATVTQLDNRLEDNRTFKFSGVWPKSVNHLELSAAEGGVLETTVLFVFDTFEIVP